MKAWPNRDKKERDKIIK